MRLPVVLVAGCLVAACPAPQASGPRAALHRVGGSAFELMPAPGQHPYCLAYTVTRAGLIRQLTMSQANLSFDCPAGKVVGGHPWQVPVAEGPVRVYVLFTSQRVSAASVSEQLVAREDRQALTAMDLRLPGAATLEAFDFAPAADDGGLP